MTSTSTYDSNGNLLTVSRPLTGTSPRLFATITYHYDDVAHPGEVTSITDPLGKTTSLAYNTNGDVTSVTDPLGHQTRSCWDGVGRKTADIAPRGTVAGVTCATASPAANTTYYTFNTFGDVTKVTDALGHETITAYDADRRVISVSDPIGNVTTNTYDLAGQRTGVTRADTTTLVDSYDDNGNLLNHTDAAGQTTTYSYDPLDRVISVTDPLNRTTSYTHDKLGNRLTEQQSGGNCAANPPTGCITSAYDAAGQLTSITYSDGTTPNVTGITYDALGRRTSVTDGTGTSNWAWDSLGRLTSETNGAGRTIVYGYDLAGQVTSIAYPDNLGTVTRAFDDTGRLTSITDWLGKTTNFGYDRDSNHTSTVFANGTTMTVTPDATGSIASITHAPTNAPLNPFASFSYTRDDARQVTGVSSSGVPSDNHTYSYTPLNQLQDVDTPAASYGYDPADNLIVQPDATVQSYDTANQLTTSSRINLVGTTTGGSATSTGAITVDLPDGIQAGDQILVATTALTGNALSAAGYTAAATAQSGSGVADAKTTLFTRTAAGTETDITLTTPLGANVAVVASVYRGVDPTSPIEAQTSGGAANTTSFNLNSITTTTAGDQLVLFQGAANNTGAGTWTPAAGMTERTQHNQVLRAGGIADQLALEPATTGIRSVTLSTAANLTGILIALKPAATTFSYDTRGNRNTKTAPGAANTTYGYDQAHRLTSYNSPGVAAAYSYSGEGLRAGKTVGTTTTSFTWSHATELPLLLTETNPDGTTAYIYGPDGTPVEQIEGTTALTYHHDQLGSTRVLTDSTGNVVATRTYDEYGNINATTGTATTPLGFAGEYRDTESGLIYLRARYYDPAAGQFLNRDPVGSLTRQPYSYADNNPVNGTDPMGLFRCPTNTSGEECAAMLRELARQRDQSREGGGINLGAAWDATGGKAVSYVNDHKVGVLQGTSVVLGAGAIVAAPFTGGTSLSALPAVLSVGSVGTAVAAEAIDPKPGRAQRVTFTAGVGILGGAISGAFTEGGLAGWGLLTDLGMFGADFLPVGQSSYVRC